MNILKNDNPWILEQDPCFIKVNMSATKLNGEQNFFCRQHRHFWWSAAMSAHSMNEMVADTEKFTFMGFIFD